MDLYLKIADIIGRIFSDLSMILIAYFIVMNIISLILFYVDKQKAKKHKWRISEFTLLSFAFMGGSVGAFMGMKLFRHKTKHPKFYIFVPLFIVLHAVIIITGIVGISL